jgi:catechol 2,3-dioxygenase-like lactoylglutathione lyase family enzyme
MMKKTIQFFFFFLLFAASHAQVKKVEGVSIVVSEMDRAVRFYSDVLGFQKQGDFEVSGEYWEKLFGVFGLKMRIVKMQLGDESIELVDYLTAGGRTIPEDFKSNDLSFQHIAIVVSNMDSAYHILRKHGVTHVSTAPQTLPPSIPAAAGIKAFYFQDLDKHNLELIYFPAGKGQEKWQRAGGRIFLGIDHTAIGVSSTTESHQFYSDIFGLERKGDSWNRGIEQAHLNNVEHASLHITGYRSAEGPGVEFLEYLFPGPGKKYPADTRADDLWNWFTKVHVKNAEKLFHALKAKGQYKLVSKELVQAKNEKTFVVRDPDGHAVWVVEDNGVNQL